MNITYNEIANFLDKAEQTVRGWKVKHPELLELIKNGALLKKYNADNHEDLKKLIEINQLLKDNNISYDKLKKILEAFKE